MKIIDRYASAVRSANLKSKPETTYSDSDVCGAMGLAGKRRPLAVALARLFTGDNTASPEIVRIMAKLVKGKAKGWDLHISRVERVDMSRSVLAWFREGTCRRCGGHGYGLIEGTRTVGDHACPACRGTRKIPFDSQFPLDHLLLARWLLAEVEREQAAAGAAAMSALAPRLDL